MTLMQDQVKGEEEDPPEKQLLDDLRVVISKGTDLRGTHCRELKVLPKLEAVLRATAHPPRYSDTRSARPHDVRFNPQAIRDAVKAGINRFSSSREEGAAERAQVLMILFGFAHQTKGAGRSKCWLAAFDYYLKHANIRNRAITQVDSFRRKVVPEELLPPLITTIIAWEEYLIRTSAGLPLPRSTAENIAHHWLERFGWLFHLERCFGDASAMMNDYLLRRSNPETITPSGIEDEIRKGRDICGALYWIGIIWESVNHTQTISILDSERHLADIRRPGYYGRPGYYLSSVDALHEMIGYFQEHFSFTPSDRDWLEIGMQEIHRANPWCGPMWMQHLLINVPRERVVFVRLRALAETCDCSVDKINEQCAMHVLGLHAERFSQALTKDWLELAKYQMRNTLIPSILARPNSAEQEDLLTKAIVKRSM